MSNSEVVDLSQLAVAFATDKEGDHHYTKHYDHHFRSLRRKRLNVLEIGIGGYENPNDGGASLRMWKSYFPNSRIFGIDIYDKTPHDEHRIKTFKGSQVDEGFLKRVAEEIGTIDIIIDDGSHVSDHVITTFKILFPLMSPDGIYVVEDLQTSYWETVAGLSWGGSRDLTAPHTSMNFFKSLVDGLNYEEFTLDGYAPHYFDTHIVSMHFYHNLLFVYKGLNNEGSNLLGKEDGAGSRRAGSLNTWSEKSLDTRCRWLNIELSSICNLRCRWCILDHEKPKRFLPLDTFERILRQVANGELTGLERIDLHNGGEALLHPQIDESLQLLARYRATLPRSLHVSLLTNGTVLNDSTLELLTSGETVDEIRVSVDGGTPFDFEHIRRNAKWRTVSGNVRRISTALKTSKSKTSLGIICMVAPDKPLDVDWMDPEFRDVIQLADNLELRHPHTWEGSLKEVDGLQADPTHKTRNRLCKFLKRDLVVMANGDVSVCCADLNGRGTIGSIDRQSLSEILGSTTRQQIIQLWRQGQFDRIPICSTCEGFYDEPAAVENDGSRHLSEVGEHKLEGMTLTQLEEVVTHEPDNAIAHNNLGVLYSQQQIMEKALVHFTKAVAANDEYMVAQKNLANVQEMLRNFDEAAYWYHRVIRREPDDVDALFGLARLSIEAGRLDSARHFVGRVLEVQPDHTDARQILDRFDQWEKDGLIRSSSGGCGRDRQKQHVPNIRPQPVKISLVSIAEPESRNSVHRNLVQWSNYEWPHGGDEWSAAWGGTENIWRATIYPRINKYLPAGHILEIAPGFGRCTQYLLSECTDLSIVDLTQKCIDHCRKRFSSHANVRYFVNDGKSLGMIEDDSIDFVFSWDSLVHAEGDVLQAYLTQLAVKLKPGGHGFIHHSNMGSHRDPHSGELTAANKHWRGESMSAELFRRYCADVGLTCRSQEILAWGGTVLNDCFSHFSRELEPTGAECVVRTNARFMLEANARK